MSKSLILILVAFLSYLYSTCQESKFEVGIEGGPSRIYLSGNSFLEEYHDPTLGYSIGLSFQGNLSKTVSFRTNFTYERKGSIFIGDTYDEKGNFLGESTTHINFEYLTFPILVRLNLIKKIEYFANAGFYFGYLIEQTLVTNAFNGMPKSKVDNTDMMENLDNGLTLGVGVGIPFRNKFFFSLEMRHNKGFSNVSEVPLLYGGSINTNSTNLLFGIAYRLGKSNRD